MGERLVADWLPSSTEMLCTWELDTVASESVAGPRVPVTDNITARTIVAPTALMSSYN